MSLSSRIKALEIKVQPMAAKLKATDRRRYLAGKFGMMDMMAFGSTSSEAREELAEAAEIHGLRDELLNSPHFDPQKADERFRAFLDSDLDNARLYAMLQARRREDKYWHDSIRDDDGEAVSLASALYLRAQAYYVAVWGAEFAEYESDKSYDTEENRRKFMEHMNAKKYQFKANEA